MPRKKQKRTVQLWDSDVLISWLKGNGDRTEDEMAGIEHAVHQVDSNEVDLKLSINIYTEVLTNDVDESVRKSFDEFLKRSNVELIDVTPGISRLAGELREYYRERNARGSSSLRSKDAQHLATAILHGCDIVYSFDAHMLGKDGNVAGRQIRIMKPPPPAQRSMGL